MTDWRRLPLVDPVDPPRRLSVTMLRHADACMRSAYLYLVHGSLPSHELDRGTALHLWAEQIPWLLLQHGEEQLEHDVGRDLMQRVLDEHPELGVTAADAVRLREMAYHLAGDARGRAGERKPDGRPYPTGFAWRPQEVVAVERSFMLEVEGQRIVGRVDLAHLGADRVLDVTDFKTSLYVPPAAEYEGTLQTKLYGALLLFGQPVTDTGELEPCVGEYVEWVRTSEVFPRYLSDDGSVLARSVVYSREELQEFVVDDLPRLVRRVVGALGSRDWPAIRGTHCSWCPAQGACPLPEHLRSHAGVINTLEQASEAMEWADAMADRVSATREEVKRFARAGGCTIPVGRDEEWAFVASESWRTDWDALQQGVERAMRYGEPFDLAACRRPTISNRFRRRRREEVAA